jgi:hypothetical protein
MNEVYKVVRWDRNGWRSALPLDKLEIEYEPGKWAVPPVGRILAFGNYEAAKEFWDYAPTRAIWRAESEDQPQPLQIITHWLTEPGKMAQFWASGESRLSEQQKPDNWTYVDAPPGTVTCGRLRLLEQLE